MVSILSKWIGIRAAKECIYNQIMEGKALDTYLDKNTLHTLLLQIGASQNVVEKKIYTNLVINPVDSNNHNHWTYYLF